MIKSYQNNSVVSRKEKVHRDNVTLVVLLSIAFFFGCIFTVFAILALVVIAK